jgi:hypothetical protein
VLSFGEGGRSSLVVSWHHLPQCRPTGGNRQAEPLFSIKENLIESMKTVCQEIRSWTAKS